MTDEDLRTQFEAVLAAYAKMHGCAARFQLVSDDELAAVIEELGQAIEAVPQEDLDALEDNPWASTPRLRMVGNIQEAYVRARAEQCRRGAAT